MTGPTPGAGAAARRASRPAPALAWVESPFQLLGILEAHVAGHLGADTVVLPRAGVGPLIDAVDEVRRLGLPRGLRIMPLGRLPRRLPEVFAAGDAFSGAVQGALVRGLPGRLVLVDDGRSTRRVLEAVVRPGVPLVRPHVRPSPARALLARAALTRLVRQVRSGGVTVVTALDLPQSLAADLRTTGVALHRHSFGWLRGFPVPAAPGPATVVLGTSLVANDLIRAGQYVAWVQGLAAEGPLTYWAHRREDDRTLGPLAGTRGITVASGRLPAELRLRGLTTQRLHTLPTTAATTLRLLAPQARIHEYAVPDGWWLDGVPAAARAHLVPDPDGRPAEAAGASH